MIGRWKQENVVQGHPWLSRESETSLGSMKPHLDDDEDDEDKDEEDDDDTMWFLFIFPWKAVLPPSQDVSEWVTICVTPKDLDTLSQLFHHHS